MILWAGVGLNLAVVAPLRNYLLDFRAYYAAGRALRMDINPYDAATVARNVPLPGRQALVPYVYPPPTLGVAYVFSHWPLEIAQVAWTLLQFALATCALLLVCRIVGCPVGSPVSVLVAFAFLLSSSVSELFRWGQFDMVVVALLAAGLWALERAHPVQAGVWLGLATVAKLTPGAYLIVLLVRREFKALLVAVVVTIGLIGVAALPLPDGSLAQWRANLARLSGDLTWNNVSLRGYLTNAFVEFAHEGGRSTPWIDLGPGVARAVAWACVGVLTIATIAWMICNRRSLTTAECIAATVPVVLLCSPITWTHHGVQTLLPLALIVSVVARVPRPSRVDLASLSLIVFLLTIWPVQRFDLKLPDWLHHLAAPTFTYGVLLTWLFMITRYAPLKRATEAETACTGKKPLSEPLSPLGRGLGEG